MRGYNEIQKPTKRFSKDRESEMIAMDNETYHYKRRYCIGCKFLNENDYTCNKNRVVRVCLKKYLKNKE